MRKDLYLENGDIAIVNGKSPRLTNTLEEYIAQKLTIILRWVKGEYFINTDLGLPYFEENEQSSMLGKNLNINKINDLIKIEILKEPEVIEILTYESELINKDRTFSVSFSFLASDNNVIEIEEALNV